MTLHKLEIEQALKSKAPAIIWNLISTADGMTRWLADTVTQEGDMLTFHWGHEWYHNEQRTAHIIYKKKQHARILRRTKDATQRHHQRFCTQHYRLCRRWRHGMAAKHLGTQF